MNAKLKKWNDAYKDVDIASAQAAQVLTENSHLLNHIQPQECVALDLACGRAGNAIYLANKNFEVDAVDISPIVLKAIEQFSKHNNLSIACECRDIENQGLSNKKYDVIVVSYFLNRALFPQIINALNPNGLLFYETWSQQKVDDSGPSNPIFRLQAGELLELTNSLHPLFYREEGRQGNISKGSRNVAMIIAQKCE